MNNTLAKHIHIITFDIPFPANYGGVIDVFYKIKALHSLGIKVHLHAYEYGRSKADVLEDYCETVNYYKRPIGLKYLFCKRPYIVATRNSKELLNNLLKDDYPILLEGIHTSFLLENKKLKSRFKVVRTHNIEHDYYQKLSQAGEHIFKKVFYRIESYKLKSYEYILEKADALVAISQNDCLYLKKKFSDAHFVPAFHPNDSIKCKLGRGDYIIYHGNLSVEENINAVLFLVNSVFSQLNFKCVIAGKDPSSHLKQQITKFSHIQLIENPSTNKMQELIANAHINVLPTFQSTGIKLKLLESMSLGRHCVANSFMVVDTGLEELCSIKNEAADIIAEIERLIDIPFSEEMIERRNSILSEHFSNKQSAQKLIDIIFN